MLMTLFKWQAKILNRLFKTERYDKLIQMQVKTPDQINYSSFFDMTPGLNPNDYSKIIEATNRLCRPTTRASIMQQQVIFLNQYLQNLSKQSRKIQQNLESGSEKSESVDKRQVSKLSEFRIQHVVIYSSLSKCRIWPKVLKSGIGFVPTLINFYNSFTKQYGDWLDFKFDPVILTQKYTKIMRKVNMKKKDHPKLVEAIKTNSIEQIDNILKKIQQDNRQKFKIQIIDQAEQKPQDSKEDMVETSIANIINNISHKSKAITHICCQQSDLKTIKHLYELGADFQLLDDEKQTALFFAVKRGDLQILKFLVEVVKVNLNHRQYQDRTALYLAAFEGDIKVVDYLYKKGADPQLCSKLDRTPLSKACYLGNIQVVKYLLSIKVDILKQDNKGRTALHNAVWGIEGGRDGKRRGHIILEDSPECAQLVINAGHPIDLQDYDGFTPFFSAVSSNAVRSVRLLYSLKADVHHKTKNKENAVFIAAKYGHLDVLKILIDEYKLSYTEPDYHGYSPLCASVTLQTPQVFFYFCDLYAKSGVKLDFSKIVECCRQYDTLNNLAYVKMWLFNKNQNDKKQVNSNEYKVKYLYQQLDQLVQNLKKLKKQKRQMKKELHSVNLKRGQFHRLQAEKQKQKGSISSEFSQKLKKQEFIEFERTLKEQQEEMTEDRQQLRDTKDKKRSQQNSKQKLTEQINHINAFTNQVSQLNKHLQSLRKIIDFLLVLGSHIIVQAENLSIAELKLKNLHYNEQNMQLVRTEVLKVYNVANHRISVAYLLSQCVHMFNKGRKSQLTDVVGLIQQLAKILNINRPTIPPFKFSNQQQDKMDQFLSLVNQTQISLSDFCKLRLTAHQSQSDLNKLLGNKQIETNLAITQQNLIDTLFRLARNRKSGTIIYLFNKREGIGKFTHDQLMQIIESKGQTNQLLGKEQQNQQPTSLTLVQYCLLHGISDMAVFLQQVCKLPHLQTIVKIRPYSINRRQLSAAQCNIDLEPVKDWVFNLKEVLSRMSPIQLAIYKDYLNIFKNETANQNQNNQQKEINNQMKFSTCNKYMIVDTKQKLKNMQKSLQKSVLIGIDVQYYGYSKQEYFICSIQIANGEMVHILDPMSHLSQSQNVSKQEQIQNLQELLTPQLIAQYVRKLMSDTNKVKIFHAYENDVKWLHEDFDLGSEPATMNTVGFKQGHFNNNVIDTSRIYNLCNKVKKGESVGLRTLCLQYLNYEMDKNFQRSDWRIRPLFKQMVQYASIDAQVLPYIFLLMLQQSEGTKAIQKIKQLFCIKRNMKGKGVRNILVNTQLENEIGKNISKQKLEFDQKFQE